mgnify:CR=1 FL=1
MTMAGDEKDGYYCSICGGIPPGPCNQQGFGCDTVIVHVLDSIHVEFNVNPEIPAPTFLDQIAFRLRWNIWNGQRNVQLIIEAT